MTQPKRDLRPGATDTLHVFLLPTLDAVPEAAWDALVGDDNPFVEHAFLLGLERSGCVGPGTGWQPAFLVVTDAAPDGHGLAPDSQLLGAVPAWLKTDSYGEFIFDQGWAQFARDNGQPYYPKLVAAVPFTPATGPRLLVATGPRAADVEALLADGLRQLARQVGAHSAHCLFIDDAVAARLEARGWFRHWTTQALWLNPGYRDFEDFLASRNARSRKQIRRERRDARGLGLELRLVTGPEMGDEEWAILRRLYLTNVDKHGSYAYLNEAFFQWIRGHFAHRVVCTLARGPQGYVAGTLNFQKGRHLYGRYWGCTEELPFLHFELAFYALIEHCIVHGLTRFEAGAGGEHKVKRGMELCLIHSAHWLENPWLAGPVQAHVVQQHEATLERLAEMATHSTRRHHTDPGRGSEVRDP